MQMNITMPNMSKIADEMKKKKKNVEKAVNRTVSDCIQRGPAQIAKAVREDYTIKSADLTAAGQGAKRNKRTAGTIKLGGVSVDNVQLIYKGRVLTPTHFSMTPKKRPDNGKKYKVRVTVKKGQKKSLGSHVFLAPSGSAGTTEIPFKRVGNKRLPIEAVRTVSIPQMITNDKVSVDIQKRMQELLTTRLQHNIDRLAKK